MPKLTPHPAQEALEVEREPAAGKPWHGEVPGNIESQRTGDDRRVRPVGLVYRSALKTLGDAVTDGNELRHFTPPLLGNSSWRLLLAAPVAWAATRSGLRKWLLRSLRVDVHLECVGVDLPKLPGLFIQLVLEVLQVFLEIVVGFLSLEGFLVPFPN